MAQSVELNRGRREARAVDAFPVLPTQADFPFAAHAARVSRAWDVPGSDEAGHYEQVWLLTSRPRTTPEDLLRDNRIYWRIEGVLHQRLDCSRLDEDRSRVRTPANALNLAMFRRLAAVLAAAWCARQRDPRRATTNGFIDAMAADNARRAIGAGTCARRAARANLAP